MIFVTYGELEIQSRVLSPSDKSIVQGLFNVGLTIFLFPSLSTHNSPVHLSLLKGNKHTKGNGFWKFNSSLIKDHMYVSEIKHLVSSFLSNIFNMNAQLKWELLKYEIREFTIDYTKRKAKERRKQQALLESELKKLENNLESSENLRKYESLKSDLELIYDHIAEGVRHMLMTQPFF